jgi:hypothetical protein
MALLDLLVDANFRSDQAGRVVIFPEGRGHRGYVVKSAAEELKIRSFLTMFYFAHVSIILLGCLLASAWSTELSRALGKGSSFLFETGLALGIYSLVVGVPYWLLWRFYKKAFLNFVSTEDQVVVSGTSASRRHWIIGAGLIASAILVLLVVMLLIR